jgi:transposase-like protein/IS1 family transposase
MNKNGKKQEINLINLIERYHNEDKCRDYLEELRWPNGVACPRCGSTSISRVQKPRVFDCNDCRYQFSVTSNTVLHDTHLPLWKWFATAYLMIESKKGISANQVKRTIGVSYKTAWYLCHRIRAAIPERNRLNGIVEVDETFVGGKAEGKGHGYKGNKTVVVGTIQRGGKAVLQVVDDRGRQTLHSFIRNSTKPDTEAIYTDEWPPYRGIGDKDTRHETVNHSKEEWVNGNVHTNTVEGVWSLLKRSIVGSYHKLSTKHLDAYLDELEWRFNNRGNPYLFRDTIKKLIEATNLPYEKLVSPEVSQS